MEIVVVVMVILVIAAIAIPNMLQARMRANEAAAVSSMNVIHTAEAMYTSTYPKVGYADNLAVLGSHGSNCETPSKSNACIIMDEALTSGLKSGYIFEVIGDGNVPVANYTLTATPESPSSSGRCGYTMSESGEVQSVPVNAGSGSRFTLGSSACSQS